MRDIKIGLGGVAATPLRAPATEAVLAGQPWTRDVVEAAAEVLAGEGTPISDHRASAAYRTAMLRRVAAQVLRREPRSNSSDYQEAGAS